MLCYVMLAALGRVWWHVRRGSLTPVFLNTPARGLLTGPARADYVTLVGGRTRKDAEVERGATPLIVSCASASDA